ncbi:hypothetical protein [Thalassobacillus sp. C254]|uniref:hypothetical protein n=1 Tax=Thalassobacillus sp. C254 TaxID=1225341 RepID=UPI0012ECFC5E|nr:hypothetical protein [Thalassobacillus sp. C254]
MKKGVLTAAVLSGCLMLGGCGQMFGEKLSPTLFRYMSRRITLITSPTKPREILSTLGW